jgi:hypothetical protein
MSQHHQAAKWASHSKGHRQRIRQAGRVQPCVQRVHVPGCPRMLDLDMVPWDVAHLTDLADGQGAGPVGPAFRRCNRSDGGTRGARTVAAARRDRARMRAW